VDSTNVCPLGSFFDDFSAYSQFQFDLAFCFPSRADSSFFPSILYLLPPQDNRVSIHAAVYDHEGRYPRHGTRVSTLAEKPFFQSDAPSRRAALGLDRPEDFLPPKAGASY
jgi:hypothetical protein